MSIPLDDLPKDLQDLLKKEGAPEKKSGKPSKPGLKEQKVAAAAKVLAVLSGFTLPQQRSILQFCIEIVERGNKKYWRDGAGKG